MNDPSSEPRRNPLRKSSDNSILSVTISKARTLTKLPSLPQIDEQPIEQATGKDALEIKSELSNRKRTRTRVYSFDDPMPGQPRQESERKEASPKRKATLVTVGNEKFCRICFEGEDENKEKNPLICPCLCDGSLKHIHQDCLKHWLFQREDSDQNYLIGARCEICKHMYHIKVEKRLTLHCQRATRDGFPSLLVALGLLVCLLNLAWLAFKYMKGANDQIDRHKNDPNSEEYIRNQHFTNTVLLVLVLTLSLMFFIPMVIHFKQAFFQKKVVSIKFLPLEVNERGPLTKLNLVNPQVQAMLPPIKEEEQSTFPQTSQPVYPVNHDYRQAANQSMDVSLTSDIGHNQQQNLEASVIIPLNFGGGL